MGEDSDDGLSDWLDEIKSVSPIKSGLSPEVVHSPRASSQLQQHLSIKRAHAEGIETKGKNSPFTLDWVEPCGPNEVLGYKREGIQEAVYKKLRLGGYPVQAVLDLHGLRLDKASQVLYDFVCQHHASGARVIRVVHGRGWRSKTEPAILKRYCAHWLRTLDIVLAYHSAQPRDGGAGALYVLLKKNNEKKTSNRHRHHHRRG